MLSVSCFFELSCPWNYLATVRLREAALRTGAHIEWRPILIEELDPRRAGQRWPVDDAEATYAKSNLAAWADYCDVDISLPDGWPADSRPAARGAVLAIEAGHARDYIDAVFRAGFSRAADIANPAVLAEVGIEAGLAGDAVERAAADPTNDAVLSANVAELRSRGGFDSATMFVGDTMFQGNESMPLVEFALGQASGRRFVVPGQHG